MATILLDRDRTLRFRFPDAMKLSLRVAGRGISEILDRLYVGDPVVLTHVLSIGLAHDERDFETNIARVGELIQAGLDKGTTMGDMNSAIVKAFKEAGIIPKDKEDGAPAPTP